MPEKPKLVAQQLPDYEPEIGAALWRLQDARRRTLRLLRDVPADIVEQETEGNSVGTILYHVALIEADWLYAEILEQPIPDNRCYIISPNMRPSIDPNWNRSCPS